MKIILQFLILLFVLHLSIVHAQSLGFAEPECGIVVNNSYYYENYSLGSHGSGYSLYHNGVEIKSEYGSFGGYGVWKLKVINENTGFYVVYQAGHFYYVYKIIGDTVSLIGNGSGDNMDLFIVNANCAYLVTDKHMFWSDDYISVDKYSDIQSPRNLINDTSLSVNMWTDDTIIGMPLCNNLTELNYRYKNGNDTLTYTIFVHISDSTYSINEQGIAEWKIFPNPVKDELTIVTSENKQVELRLYDITGRNVLKTSFTKTVTLQIEQFGRGAYIYELRNDAEVVEVGKIIKE